MTPALSPSRAADFKQCPLLYRFRVIDRLPAPPSPAAARGTLVHSALERLFDLPAPQRTPDNAAALLPQAWADLVADEPALAEMLTASAVGLPDWLASAEQLVRRWFDLEDPARLEPSDRELYVEVDLDGLTLRGYVDRLDEAPGSGALRVVDYKTGRSPSERFEGKALFQMKFYALVLWRLRGRIPSMLQLVYLGDGQLVRYVPDEADLRGLEVNLKAVWAAIESAATTGDWRPSPGRLCDWCDFRSLCPAFGGTPPPLPSDAERRAVDPAVTGEPEEQD
ncbi:MAG: RecB family exonuclease [Nostocoides sp.]